MVNIMKHFSFLAALLLASANSASADTTWTMDRVDAATGKVIESQRVLIANNKVRINAGAGNWILFDATKNTLTQVMDDKKKFISMDEATINNLVAMQSAAMQKMKTQMAMLPPAQRAQMEAMMNKMSPQAAQAKEEVKVQATGKSKEIAGHPCKAYEVMLGTKKVSENCLANKKDFKIDDADMHTLETMIKFSKRMTEKMPLGGEVSAATSGFLDTDDLIPIESQPFQNGQPAKHKMVFNSLSSDSIPANQFEVPAGYVQQSMPKMQ